MINDPMDEGEIAAAYAAQHNATSVAAVVAEIPPPSDAPPGDCLRCGGEISLARWLAYPSGLCVSCQAAKERLKERPR